jgi:hypothetical protein
VASIETDVDGFHFLFFGLKCILKVQDAIEKRGKMQGDESC